MRYIIRDREAGNRIATFQTLDAAQEELLTYEKADKEEGTYTKNFYEIVEQKTFRVWFSTLWGKELPEEIEADSAEEAMDIAAKYYARPGIGAHPVRVEEYPANQWLCRTWTKRDGSWTSEIDRFNTKAEAEDHGKTFVNLIGLDDEERTYEIHEVRAE